MAFVKALFQKKPNPRKPEWDQVYLAKPKLKPDRPPSALERFNRTLDDVAVILFLATAIGPILIMLLMFLGGDGLSGNCIPRGPCL